MSVEAEPEMVTVPRAELEALKAEVRLLRRKEGDRVALQRMMSGEGPGSPGHISYTREQLADMWGIVD